MKIRETITREKVLDIVAHHENTIFYDWFTVNFAYNNTNNIISLYRNMTFLVLMV